MATKRLTALKGGKKQAKTSTCISCDDEGRIWTWRDADVRTFKFCWCEIGQELKAEYCRKVKS